jgi:hypothetical protein
MVSGFFNYFIKSILLKNKEVNSICFLMNNSELLKKQSLHKPIR